MYACTVLILYSVAYLGCSKYGFSLHVSIYDSLRCSFRVLSCCLMVTDYLIKIIMVVANLYYYMLLVSS
jgi:hypothetical protein